jgi:carbamoyltransferase
MIVVGINAYHGDASACVLHDGQLIAAVEEERFRRVKHWAGFPREALRACLRMTGMRPEDVDAFAFSRQPKAHLFRKLLFILRHRPSTRLVRDRLANARRVHDGAMDLSESLDLARGEVASKIHWIEHHPAHLASAFFVSPFAEAAVCAIDGFGDFVSTSWGVGRGNQLRLRHNVYFPHSLGLLYLAVTQYLGFPRYGDEYKVMGLAPYGEPDYVEALRRLVHLKPDGDFALDLSYFSHWSGGGRMTWDGGEPEIAPVFTDKFVALLGPARQPEEPLTAHHEAVAASLQVVFEETAFHVLRNVYQQTRLPHLCLAGGCAMNSVMNGKICEQTPFREVYIQPAAGDNGTALGAAYSVWHQQLGRARSFVMSHAYWGPEFDSRAIQRVLSARTEELRRRGCMITTMDDHHTLCQWTAERIAAGNIVGWFQGRMEWGARALGHRSILADPRRADMRDRLNAKIKFREKFRPFAPSILEEAVAEYFVTDHPDPFMLHVYPVRTEKRAVIPAVTHVDGSGRLQTVSVATDPLYWQLLAAFRDRTGVPVLLNTSFNENEPIVHHPEEALDCFLRTQMDVLVMGHYVVEKRET